MARELPFTINPKPVYREIGNEDIGVLKFRVRRGVSLPERLAVREVDESDALFDAISKFCLRLQRDAEVEDVPFAPDAGGSIAQQPLHVLYLAVNGILDQMAVSSRPALDPLQAEIALRYPEEVKALANQQEENNDCVIVRKATVMITNRLDNCPDGWDDADTRSIGRMGQIVEIADIYDMESRGTIEDAQSTVSEQLDQLKDLLGKLPPEPGDRLSSPTGETSTGDAVPPTPETTSSDPTPSALSPSTTSSRRPARRPRRKD